MLELPENYLADAHAYDETSEDHMRYMIYNVRSQEEWVRVADCDTGTTTDSSTGQGTSLLQGRTHRLRQPDATFLAARGWSANPHPRRRLETRQARVRRHNLQCCRHTHIPHQRYTSPPIAPTVHRIYLLTNQLRLRQVYCSSRSHTSLRSDQNSTPWPSLLQQAW